MDLTLSKVVEVVAGFVASNHNVSVDTIGPSTRLLQEGLLDSFSLVSLIAELERVFGVELPEGTLLPDDFESPQVLCERLHQL